TPQILQGKVCATKAKQALEKWYVEFYFNDKRTRLSNQLNRIKDYSEKLDAFTKLKNDIHQQLKDGTYGRPQEKPVIIPSLKDAVSQFVKWHTEKGSRPKTVQSYESKLKYLTDVLGGISVNYIYHKDIYDLLIALTKQLKWSNKTFNNCRLIYSGLFQFAIECRYISVNPVSRIKTKFVGKSTRNTAFIQDDFNRIMVEVEKDTM